MPTVINNPPNNTDGSGDGGMGSGILIGVIIVVIIGIAVFFVYGLPNLRAPQPADQNINVEIPNPLDNNNSGTGGDQSGGDQSGGTQTQ